MISLNKLKPLTTFKLFTPEECETIINSIDEDKIEYHKFVDFYKLKVDAYRIDNKALTPDIRKLIVDRVTPLSKYEMKQCFILKYDENTIPDMKPHYDICTHTLVINLNNNFNGGETEFPAKRFKHKPQEYENGTALFFKGDTILSWHRALPVSNGVKYSLNVKYEKKLPFIWFAWALIKFYPSHVILSKIFD